MKLANSNIDVIDWTGMNLDVHMQRWKQMRSVYTQHVVFSPLISSGGLQALFCCSLPSTLSWVRIPQRSWPYAFPPWFGQSPALCQLSKHATSPAVSEAKAPPVVALVPQFTLHGRLHSAVTNWLSPRMCRVSSWNHSIMCRKFPVLCSHERIPEMSAHSHTAGPAGKGQSKSVSHLVSGTTPNFTHLSKALHILHRAH